MKQSVMFSILLFAGHASGSGCRPGHSGGESASGATTSSGTDSGATTSVTSAAATTGSGTCDGGSSSDGCSVSCQDCPPGQKCTISDASGEASATCVPLPDKPKGEGELCASDGPPSQGIDDCDRGYACVGYPVFPDAKCVPFCTDSAMGVECSENARCGVVDGKPACIPICDPREAGKCPGACRPLDTVCPDCFPMVDSGTFACWFAPPVEVGIGFPCPIGECQETLYCGPSGRVPGCDKNTPCCTEYCNLDGPICPQGTTCTPVFKDGHAPNLLLTLGACLTP